MDKRATEFTFDQEIDQILFWPHIYNRQLHETINSTKIFQNPFFVVII